MASAGDDPRDGPGWYGSGQPEWSPGPPPLPPPSRTDTLLPVAIVVLLVLILITGGALVWLRVRGSGSVEPAVLFPASPGSAPAGAVLTAKATPSVLTTPSPAGTASTTTAAPPSAGFVAELDALLDRSSSARANVSSTSLQLQSCRVTPTAAATTFRQAGQMRHILADQAAALASGPEGSRGGTAAAAIAAFVALTQYSAQADDALAKWADELAGAGCRTSTVHTASWESASGYSASASAAKGEFVRMWNPIATAAGRAARSADQI